MIRLMEERDVSAVHNIEKECFSMPWSESSLLDAVNSPDSLFFVLEEQDQVIGYMGMYLVQGEADITNIAIKKEKQGQGYGKRLLEYVVEYTMAQGILDMTLEVRSSNIPALKLYEGMEFRTEGIRKNFYDFPKEDACIMWRRKSSD